MLRPAPPPGVHRSLAAAVAALVMATSSRANAEEGRAPTATTEKTVATITVISGYSVAALGLGATVLFRTNASDAYEERRAIAGRNGDASALVWRCAGTGECGRMASLREDQDDATSRSNVALGVAISGALVGTAALAAYLLFGPEPEAKARAASRVRLAPLTDGRNTGGVALGGSF